MKNNGQSHRSPRANPGIIVNGVIECILRIKSHASFSHIITARCIDVRDRGCGEMLIQNISGGGANARNPFVIADQLQTMVWAFTLTLSLANVDLAVYFRAEQRVYF